MSSKKGKLETQFEGGHFLLKTRGGENGREFKKSKNPPAVLFWT